MGGGTWCQSNGYTVREKGRRQNTRRLQADTMKSTLNINVTCKVVVLLTEYFLRIIVLCSILYRAICAKSSVAKLRHAPQKEGG